MPHSLMQLVGIVYLYFWEKGNAGKQCVCNIVPRYRFSSIIQIYERKAELFLGTLIILSLDFKMEELCRLLFLIQQFLRGHWELCLSYSIFEGKCVLISKIISQELEDLTLIDQSWRCSALPEPFALVHILRSFGLSVLKGLKLGNILLKFAH